MVPRRKAEGSEELGSSAQEEARFAVAGGKAASLGANGTCLSIIHDTDDARSPALALLGDGWRLILSWYSISKRACIEPSIEPASRSLSSFNRHRVLNEHKLGIVRAGPGD